MKTSYWNASVRHFVLALLGMLSMLPFAMLINLSFKDLTQFNLHRFSFTWPIHWENYSAAWGTVGRFIFNSFVISGVTVAGVLVISCMAAYPLARMRFFLKEQIYFLIISLLMIPSILTLVPLYSLIIRLGWVNEWLGLWGPYIAGGQVFCIFVLRSFFASLPEEMFEAARMDGATELRVLRSLVVPLSRPILGTLGVLNVLSSWNEYVWPFMVINNVKKQPIPVGLLFFQNQFTTNWGPLFAGYVIASIPLVILFFLTSKQFLAGLTSGAIKM